YNSNIKDTINWLDTTDTALNQATKALDRVRELMVAAGDAAYGSGELRAIKDEINEKISELSQIMNTSFDGKYIFGGTRGDKKPIESEVDANGNTQLKLTNKDDN
ncbi:MAG TPA: flagellar hook-associated protein 3, partial [Clostridium sp.]|nr:flagellar hook-associated protein 3 [Clostridium sp.]